MTEVASTPYPQGGTALHRAWNLMANWFVFGSEASPSDIDLEVPDASEEQDLKRHAARCALRYRSLKEGQRANSSRLQRIEIIILIVGVWLIATSPQFHDILKTLLGL